MNKIHLHRQQRGVTLIVGLIFLVALTLLGVMAMKSAVLQERMAGGSRDHSLAFQAAEAALRDAKRDILGLRANGTACPAGAAGCRAVDHKGVPGATEYKLNCANGLCRDNPCTDAAGNPVPDYAFGIGPHTVFPLTGAPGVPYGTFTSLPLPAPPISITGVAAQPRYLIEYFTRSEALNPPGACASEDIPMYRITARAVGANPNTVVTLQEVYTP